MGLPGDGDRLELTYNFGVDSYESAPAMGTSPSPSTTSTPPSSDSKEQGIEPERAPYSIRDGGSLLCFVRDPDQYRIELIERGSETGRVTNTG